MSQTNIHGIGIDAQLIPLGGSGKSVEVDETYMGRVRGMRKSRGPSQLGGLFRAVQAADAGRVHQHCGEQHLHRYLAELDFRYNHRSALKVTDAERALSALNADLPDAHGGRGARES